MLHFAISTPPDIAFGLDPSVTRQVTALPKANYRHFGVFDGTDTLRVVMRETPERAEPLPHRTAEGFVRGILDDHMDRTGQKSFLFGVVVDTTVVKPGEVQRNLVWHVDLPLDGCTLAASYTARAEGPPLQVAYGTIPVVIEKNRSFALMAPGNIPFDAKQTTSLDMGVVHRANADLVHKSGTNITPYDLNSVFYRVNISHVNDPAALAANTDFTMTPMAWDLLGIKPPPISPPALLSPSNW